MTSNRATRRDATIVYILTASMSVGAFLRGQLGFLRRAGFRVHAVSSPGPELELIRASEGVPSTGVPMNREIDPLEDAKSLLRLFRLLQRLRPDVTNVGTPKAGLLGGLAAAAARVPVRVYTLHGLRLETVRGTKRALLTFTERIACACAHRVVCVSPSLRERAINMRLARPEKFAVLGSGSANGVESDRFAPTPTKLAAAIELKSRLGLPLASPVVGFVGRFTRDKGILELLDAFDAVQKELPEARLLLVGDYEDGDPLPYAARARLEGLHGAVRTGFVADPALYYLVMDVLAFPTHREGLGNVALEAAAAGKPVVAAAATGANDAVLDGVTGILVPVGDAAALARALLSLVRQPDLARRLGSAGQSRVSYDFAPSRVWNDLEALYAKLLAERRDARLRPVAVTKRCIDLTVAIVALILSAPVWVLAAIAIKLGDGGPVFFAQERVGHRGRRFVALKFRSMVRNAERKGLGLAVAQNDERITRVGRFIRATSVDELPQLLNVLRGEMSVVGPRPTVPSQVSRYDAFQLRRLEVKPGLTGWAQVNGRNGISWDRRIELDVWYVDHRSLLLDLLILLRTPAALIPRPDTHYGSGGVVEDFKGRGP